MHIHTYTHAPWLYLDAEVLVLSPVFFPQDSVFVGCRLRRHTFDELTPLPLPVYRLGEGRSLKLRKCNPGAEGGGGARQADRRRHLRPADDVVPPGYGPMAPEARFRR